MPPEAPSRPSRWIASAALAAGAIAAYGAFQGWRNLDALGARREPVAMGALALATLAPALCLLGAARARRHGLHAPTVARRTLVVAVATWLGTLAAAGEFHRIRVEVALAVGAGLFGLVLLSAPRAGAAARPASRAAEIVLFNLSLLVVLAEVALRVVAQVAPSPLTAGLAGGVDARIAAHAYAPGELHFGFACNSRGFFDEEFSRPEGRTRRAVAVIGDSFSASTVPHPFHYTTVCERALGDVDVWNVGWSYLGPDEYLRLLEREVLPLRPDAVVVAIYLGNDVTDVRAWNLLDRVLAAAFDRGSVLLFEIPRRLLLLANERRRGAGRPPEPARGTDPAALREALPWIDDVALEPPAFSEPAYERMLVQKARAIRRIGEGSAALLGALERKRWEALTARLLEMRDRAGKTPFGVMLIPDEMMVEDALWARVEAASASESLDRHGLRERLAAFCEANAIPCLDVWPALRAVPPMEDGDRHLYHLRDSHWNVRGNEVAGKALAAFARSLLATPGR